MTERGSLLDKLKRMQERNARSKEAEPSAPAAEPVQQLAQVIRLPLWPEAVRGVPNGLLRSALFGAIKRGARRYLERQEVHAQDGVTVRYTGARLDQGDLDVWETVLHTVRAQELGDDCRVTAYQLLKALDKRDTGGNRDVLERRLARLKATALDVKVGRYSYMGSLIDEVYRDDETREYVIRLNPKLHTLFASDQFTQVDWSVRHALDGKPLAQWLHGFYASHTKPYPMKIKTLHKLCGSETAELWKFAQTLRKSLDAVVEASEACEQPFSYEICGDLVHVEKAASKAQRQHLAKKAAKPSD
ncbi:plasmid replication initiator TrfA [Azotobacter chroococcum]|uniref:Replication initiation protein n=1 Tax=Azotobacter chroococcum NCIMB 8003 TaxID=1328314 RepID=A0A0C4WKV9_9GAMM|nr:plasmid replication initiator TrfA [Azotobacter chroococcum]AJE23468.1 Replication initiation protein [Azotobacter chroococcum NCIMB 8003]